MKKLVDAKNLKWKVLYQFKAWRNNMEQNKEYFVFISYSSLDNEWAIWLRHELEHYHLPASFNWRTDVRDNLRKVFRDREELSAGPEWDEQVQKA